MRHLQSTQRGVCQFAHNRAGGHPGQQLALFTVPFGMIVLQY
jgi:hypothetical protein